MKQKFDFGKWSMVASLSVAILFGLLSVTFLGLKISGVISWSWWLVFLPVFINVIFAFVLGLWAIVSTIKETK